MWFRIYNVEPLGLCPKRLGWPAHPLGGEGAYRAGWLDSPVWPS